MASARFGFGKAEIVCALSFALYWSWTFAVLIMPMQPAYATGSIGTHPWFVSTLFHALTLWAIAFFHGRIKLLENENVLTWAYPVLSLAGYACVMTAGNYEAQEIFGVVGAAIIGCGTAFYPILWCGHYVSLYDSKAKGLVVFAGVIIAATVDLLLLVAPSSVVQIALSVIPVCAVFLLKGSQSDPEEEGAQGERERISIQLVLICLVYSIPLGFFQQLFCASAGTTQATWLPVLGTSIAIIAILFFFTLENRERANPNTLLHVAMLISIAATMLITVAGSDGLWSVGVLTFVSQQVLAATLYSMFAAISVNGGGLRIRAFGYGICATDVGFMLGMLAAWLPQAYLPEKTSLAVLGVTYALVIVGFLALRSGVLSKKESGSAPVSGTLPSLDKVTSFVRSHDLTKRESEIFQHLLKGKNVPAIANEMLLSQNTLRSHIAHIYQKTGVHSRSELIALFEGDPGPAGF